MFSNAIQAALEREIVGQPQALNAVVRGVTRVTSGLTPHERPLAAYLLMGPTGVGKSQTARAVARFLHGDDRQLVVADCNWGMHGDPWMSFATQLAPLFTQSTPNGDGIECPPLSVILVEGLESGPPELCKTLSRVLESTQIMLPQGRHGLLRNCIVFLTSRMCSREILDEASPIGFTS
ncbi:MAG: ATP-dependent Clp protease ATP-binding subunit, partial [Planctomycetes bacterium]|nr:ATP-dependent Clp protease ATP-binding subunit [Planctomycetota bacterium]